VLTKTHSQKLVQFCHDLKHFVSYARCALTIKCLIQLKNKAFGTISGMAGVNNFRTTVSAGTKAFRSQNILLREVPL